MVDTLLLSNKNTLFKLSSTRCAIFLVRPKFSDPPMRRYVSRFLFLIGFAGFKFPALIFPPKPLPCSLWSPLLPETCALLFPTVTGNLYAPVSCCYRKLDSLHFFCLSFLSVLFSHRMWNNRNCGIILWKTSHLCWKGRSSGCFFVMALAQFLCRCQGVCSCGLWCLYCLSHLQSIW